MGRSPCCEKDGLNRGAWTVMEDSILTDYINVHGEGKWRHLPKIAGLKRCGKSCRLRWFNYLRPGIKRGNITNDEEDLIIRLHDLLGNRWSLIAGRLPGRTDNEIKNYWNTIILKKLHNLPVPSTHNHYRHNGPNPTLNAHEASRCRDADNGLAARPPSTVETSVRTENGLMDLVIPESTSENTYSVDMLLDFEIDEELLYDVLNAEYYEVHQFEGGGSG